MTIPEGFMLKGTTRTGTPMLVCETCLQKARMRDGKPFCVDGERHRAKKERS